jgi:AcrR family transcriptional regulator
MVSVAVRDKRRQRRPAIRAGRPPRALAGAVDERILDAARRLFLDQGLGGASIDEIARLARAGKPTIYARFPTKEALFTAVAMRNAARVRAGFESFTPAGNTLKERLTSVATNILNRLFSSDAIDFMRLSVLEARRFPDLINVGRMARARAAQAVTQALREVAHSVDLSAYPGLAPASLETATQLFMDLVVARPLLRALLGEDLKQLRGETETHVARSIEFFLAACRQSEFTGSAV